MKSSAAWLSKKSKAGSASCEGTEAGAHRAERVTHAAGIDAAVRVHELESGARQDCLRERLHRDAEEAPDQLRVFVARVEGRVAASAWMYLHPGSQFASLWGGTTLPEFRRQGCYSALVRARIEEARGRNYRYLTIDANSQSEPIARKFGSSM